MPRFLAFLGRLATLAAIGCATPTAINVSVDSEVACNAGATAVLVGAASLSELPSKAPSSTSSQCIGAGGGEAQMGNVVLVPAAQKNEGLAFAVMTRPDGQPPDGCLEPAQAGQCIVSRRELRFLPRTEVALRIDLRLSCLGVTCPLEQTCVKGACVGAEVNSDACNPSCDEGSLVPADAGVNDAGDANDAHRDASGAGPVTLASGLSGVGIALDATNVYVTTGALGSLVTVSQDGGTVNTLASGLMGTYGGVAVTGATVYWTNQGSFNDNYMDGTVLKLRVGDVAMPTTLATAQEGPVVIAVDATSVYWGTSGAQIATVMKMPQGGGGTTMLASGQDGVYAIAVDATSVYWTTSANVMKVPISSASPPVVLASGQESPSGIAVDATSVYWTTSNSMSDPGGAVLKVPLGGGPITTLASGQTGAQAIAVDGTSVYWANRSYGNVGQGSIVKVPTVGGTPTTLVSGLTDPTAIAVNATSVFWLTGSAGNGNVMKVGK